MIRVLELLTATTLGGGPRQVFDLVRHLPGEEFRISVAGPRDAQLAADLRTVGVELSPVDVDSLRAFPLTLQRVRRLVQDTRADVVHTHGKGAGLYGRLAANQAGVPSVHTFHGIHYESYSRAGRALYLALERWLARLTHTVINVSASQDREALKLGVALPGRSAIIVNGIDVGELAARPAADRMELGLDPDAEVIGCVARFDPVKKHDVLVEALATVRKRHPKAVLLLAGDGPEKERIRQRASELEVHVEFKPGAIAWNKNAYASCSLYVTSSSKEGLPLAPLEAMASSLAVVATDVPGHQDVVERNTTGLLVSPAGGAQALATAIESLLDDPERRRRMGQAGRARVLREFTLESMVDKTAAVYRAAAASRRASRRS
ncbi:MAG TPA: glycosyltransferase [Methylomirabilota bacterium]|nr:glycosyltransferase [Methylomirabilota bacterium]